MPTGFDPNYEAPEDRQFLTDDGTGHPGDTLDLGRGDGTQEGPMPPTTEPPPSAEPPPAGPQPYRPSLPAPPSGGSFSYTGRRSFSGGGNGGPFIAQPKAMPKGGELVLDPRQEGPGAYTEPTGAVEASPWEVTADQLTSTHMEKIMNRDNPLMMMTREKARRAHLAAGGQNSLMATQAGEMAVIDKAFQIGQADAAVYARSAEFNASMKNQFGLAELAFIHQSLASDQSFKQAQIMQEERIKGDYAANALLQFQDLTGRSILTAQEITGRSQLAAQEHRNMMARIQTTFQMDMSKMGYAARLQEGQEARNFTRTWQLTASQNYVNFYQNGFAGAADVMSNPNLTPEQANAAGRAYMDMVRQGMGVMSGFYTNGAGSYGDYSSGAFWMLPPPQPSELGGNSNSRPHPFAGIGDIPPDARIEGPVQP